MLGKSKSSYLSCEDLLVGDDSGCLYYYSVYWPDFGQGQLTLITKLDAHSQNICGLAWSPDGKTFVSGGNDNAALLFTAEDVLSTSSLNCVPDFEGNNVMGDDTSSISPLNTGILTPPQSPSSRRVSGQPYIVGQHPLIEQFGMPASPVLTAIEVMSPPMSPERGHERGRTVERHPRFIEQTTSSNLSNTSRSRPPPNLDNRLANPGVSGRQSMHRKAFYHSAAVKAIAYAPWQPTLLATSGGSNDRQIHFHHTESGSTLAVINVYAQVTSLSWSFTRREIVATFGYAQPEHDIRIAVFAWPSCECVVSIPWERKANGEIGRALWATPYPGGPNDAALDAEDEDTDSGFQAWEALQAQEARVREAAGLTTERSLATADATTPTRARANVKARRRRKARDAGRGEGEAWASRTEEEGSLIIACCDQTVKFFEVWAGKSKGRSVGIGSKAGVLGGSKVLEGWCEGVNIDEVKETHSIR